MLYDPLSSNSNHYFTDVTVQVGTSGKEQGIYIPLLVAGQVNGIVSIVN
jgi:hypothetical protein